MTFKHSIVIQKRSFSRPKKGQIGPARRGGEEAAKADSARRLDALDEPLGALWSSRAGLESESVELGATFRVRRKELGSVPRTEPSTHPLTWGLNTTPNM